MPSFHFFNTQTVHSKSVVHNSIQQLPQKPYTLAGFEPGPSFLEADAMSTASRRQSNVVNVFILLIETFM
jgi:hypothetical protein